MDLKAQKAQRQILWTAFTLSAKGALVADLEHNTKEHILTGEEHSQHLLGTVRLMVKIRYRFAKPSDWKQHMETRSGATKKTTRRDDRRIVQQALVDPTVTRSTIRADVGVAIVPQTISRHLAEANLKSKRPFRALPLTPEYIGNCVYSGAKPDQCGMSQIGKRLCLVMNPGLFGGKMITVYGCGDALVSGTPKLFYVTLPALLV
ncbi:HTH_Tnp_Tc3_2 domain-containing protein [Trichonephila clavipes]|nr:HTH_Tnp_Tc3_2 domain-containing protein [Trichonephila clavipes]